MKASLLINHKEDKKSIAVECFSWSVDHSIMRHRDIVTGCCKGNVEGCLPLCYV